MPLIQKLIFNFVPSLKLRFRPPFKITFLPQVQNKMLFFPPAQNYDSALSSKLRFCLQFKIKLCFEGGKSVFLDGGRNRKFKLGIELEMGF
ncbi:hypothetical protein HanIR_Chr02g0087841 [Helianthus annuus]|nr:hypothetical protein HanIR_Chr02g0087841 [Helianthus annuus]